MGKQSCKPWVKIMAGLEHIVWHWPASARRASSSNERKSVSR